METKPTHAPEGESSTKVRFAVVAVLAVVAVTLLFLGASYIAGMVVGGDSWDVEAGQSVEVTVEPGSSATSIYRTMHDAGVVRSSDLQAAVRAAGVEDRLQAGTYSLTTGMEPDAVVRRLVEGGDVASDFTFTVIEAWTIDRIIDELADATAFTKAEFQKALRSGDVTSLLLPDDGSDPLTRWEGLLFPAKYPMLESATPTQILQMMADEMIRRFEDVDWSGIGELGISRYEALVIGSLIEWEAGTEGDRPIIASVIHNRLAESMRLQIDATVIYALGHNPGRVLAEHLKVESPYNTYRINGLPPTPIGTVSEASLHAAINPHDTDYLFYVLGYLDGSHAFAVTYEEHQSNIEAAKEAGILP